MTSSVDPITSGSGSRFSERYDLGKRAGMGGMGAVYRAIDRQSGAVVAIKILHSRGTLELARFDQETRVLAELSHPGIVRYFNHGTTADGAPYLAMEWLDGETLEDRLARGRLGPAEATSVAHPVLAALSAAHGRNIVHRDIKPGNIFLVGGNLTDVRVLDFGIARRVFDIKRLTRSGSTVGTPLYTSPEQARGRADVDGRADIFSLGCVLFEMLAGEPPFTGATPLEVMTKVCAGRAPELASRRAGLPPGLTSLIDAMLAKEPARRPQSAAALADQFAGLGRSPGDTSSDHSAAGRILSGRRGPILESHERMASAMLVALGKRATHKNEPFLVEVRCLSERFACVLDRLIDGTLLVTVRAASTAEEQAIRLASAALALRELEPAARIAIATGRTAILGQLPVGPLMDRLPTLMEGQEAGTIRLDEATRRLLPPCFTAKGSQDHPSVLVGSAPKGPDRRRDVAAYPSSQPAK